MGFKTSTWWPWKINRLHLHISRGLRQPIGHLSVPCQCFTHNVTVQWQPHVCNNKHIASEICHSESVYSWLPSTHLCKCVTKWFSANCCDQSDWNLSIIVIKALAKMAANRFVKGKRRIIIVQQYYKRFISNLIDWKKWWHCSWAMDFKFTKKRGNSSPMFPAQCIFYSKSGKQI